MNELTHASFFSGVGGTDLGLERAGWRTVSFSEIDPYACAVLAERWPGVVNVGDIVQLARATPDAELLEYDARDATLWSGGFPCQDLSVAGKRRGFGAAADRARADSELRKTGGQLGHEPGPDAGGGGADTDAPETRSGLAFAFLALVERHRPPAILLENVPGLLSSHGGRDMAALIGRMVELGYGVAYRVLDAQYFGVPQRRRRVFILGLRCDPDDVDGRIAAERAAAVLSVGARCGRHPATGHETGTGAASGAERGADAPIFNATAKFGGWEQDSIAGNLRQRDYKSSNHLVSTPPDADRMRAPDGLAGRAHDSEPLAPTLLAPGREGGRRDKVPVTVTQSLPTQRVGTDDNDAQGGFIVEASGMNDDPLLPLGLDSHRYRCCGNGVVAPVAEWLGLRLAEALA